MPAFLTPSHEQRTEFEIKRSRFITTVIPIDSSAAAKRARERLRAEFPDARHHCWAMISGAPDEFTGRDQSDDGEPKGTAGRPMLNVLEHSGLGRTLVVVTRYFGGVKLGAGGLVRAYSRAVSEALATLETVTVVPTARRRVVLDYAELDSFEYRLRSQGIHVTTRDFTERVTLELEVPEDALAEFDAMLANRLP
ncbi:MAG: YigZ family protein [Gammaproteobacteria bacterium]|nr:MAG: YigZ family protein [Gammaproteobacteria bacterium]